MDTVVFVLQILMWILCPAVIGLILLQGAAGDISSSFGGGGQLDASLGVGAHRKMAQVTGFLAAIFFVIVLVLAYPHKGSFRDVKATAAPAKPAAEAVKAPAAPAPAPAAPKVEAAPAPAPAPEAPKAEAPAPAVPKAEAPAAPAPAAEAPKAEAPKVEAAPAPAPAVEAKPAAEAPAKP